ncbi:MAG: Ferredoxin-dependent glutamate synthase 1 [Elusimicrobia bacterium]|nr:Ferredoxin-dependent glutamate synthase 1 [Elusimicrobiota bacterium]
MRQLGLPPKQGLYDPQLEKDSCGVGFIVHIKGNKSHQIVEDGLTILKNLAHRGACGCDPLTGDGAGILIQVPHKFLKKEAAQINIALPESGSYGVGFVFLPIEKEERAFCLSTLEATVKEEGQKFLGWRDVPVVSHSIGHVARSREPIIKQFFVEKGPQVKDQVELERKLLVIRKLAERKVSESDLKHKDMFYLTSLSSFTIVYKGQLMSEQLHPYFPDLADKTLESALAMVHSRYSTNTFPSWDRAHPYRFLAHNGEINTLRGNVNWMHARETLLSSPLFGTDIKKLMPVINPNGSDSAMFDNAVEMLVAAGRSLPHAMLMMVPEAWSGNEAMSAEKKAFYEYHSCLMEPWDGPASMAFTDGKVIGALLDRNGLRPSRYYVTKDDRVIMASEVGVLPVDPQEVVLKGRLQPGKMFLVDTTQGRIISDEEIKKSLVSRRPYGQWLQDNMVRFDRLPEPPNYPEPDHASLLKRQKVFGYTLEDLKYVLQPMAAKGEEGVGSMGEDTPLAVLSERPKLLYNYFKQLFAQVTNPAIDSIREESVMSTEGTLGPEGNLLEETPEQCHQLKLTHPIIGNKDLAKIRAINEGKLKAATLPILFKKSKGVDGLAPALQQLCQEASRAIKKGFTILILSDRGVDVDNVPIPALLATAAVHHHLIREGTRTKVGLAVETGEARELHHFALLIGYGAGAINPYGALETIADMIKQGLLPKELTFEQAFKNYIKATKKGLLKIIAKMGISTIQSYRGAQIFEAVGLNPSVIDKYFTWTASRVAGVDIETIAEECLMRHRQGFPDVEGGVEDFDVGGFYQWRKDGEYHMVNPNTIHKLQYATRTNNRGAFKEFSRLIDERNHNLATLRGLMKIKFSEKSIPIDEVEPVSSIAKRFCTGAMSFGSISREAHEALAIAMNRLGGRSNTGEGGEDAGRFKPDAKGDLKRSKIKQVASGRFGVTSHYLVNADEIQIKISQGAKPGEGGQLHGAKVTDEIAAVRNSIPGVTLISPPPHHDIYSIEDLAQLIFDLKNANPKANVSVKLVSEVGVGTVAAGVAKGKADLVLIAGHEGGTGASPLTSLKYAGLPWELGLAETQQVLVMNDLRGRIRVQTDGQMKTARDCVIAFLLGADEIGFSTAPLITLGCVMMRVCHLNTCPVGVATQDPDLRKKFTGKPEYVVNFFTLLAEEIRELLAKLGVRSVDEIVGHVERLEMEPAVDHWKAKGVDLSSILFKPKIEPPVSIRHTTTQDHGLEKVLDYKLIEKAKPALEKKSPVKIEMPINNVDRTVGAILSSEVSRKFEAEGLADGTIHCKLKGSAGQSFGAFLAPGITLELEGDANDYVGKGLSGGRVIVYPSKQSVFAAEENMIVGNVVLYGAIKGEAFFRGMAGERFAVRNSGARAVVESVGDHGCEYMTGGVVAILGATGRNFAAGMSGGIAYVLDQDGQFKNRCNLAMVDLEPVVEKDDVHILKNLIHRHGELTGSPVAKKILSEWEAVLPKFVKVYPKEYRRALGEMAAKQSGRAIESKKVESWS